MSEPNLTLVQQTKICVEHNINKPKLVLYLNHDEWGMPMYILPHPTGTQPYTNEQLRTHHTISTWKLLPPLNCRLTV